MIWWGYAGLSAAILFSLVLIALIIGVSTGTVLALAANTATVLLALGVFVHVCAITLRNRRRSYH